MKKKTLKATGFNLLFAKDTNSNPTTYYVFVFQLNVRETIYNAITKHKETENEKCKDFG